MTKTASSHPHSGSQWDSIGFPILSEQDWALPEPASAAADWSFLSVIPCPEIIPSGRPSACLM